MEPTILLSIIIPVYNAETTLSRCLDSILCQAGEDVEILLVNDASSDGSLRVIERYVKDYPKIVRGYENTIHGPGFTRNYGMMKATGRYLAFADSDDHIAPDYLETIRDIIRRENPDMIFIDYDRIYERKRTFMERIHRFSGGLPVDETVTLSEHPEIICRAEGAPWLRILRRELIVRDDRLLFSTSKMAEDQEVGLKWYLSTPKIHFCSKKLYHYVIHTNSLNFSTGNLNDFVGVVQSVCAYYQSQGVFEKYRTELELVFTRHLLVSNLRRLKASDLPDKFSPFMSLRATLIEHFPEFQRNPYLAHEPFYIRMAVWLSWRYPWIFKYIL